MKRVIALTLGSVACCWACSTYSGLDFDAERGPVGASGSSAGGGEAQAGGTASVGDGGDGFVSGGTGLGPGGGDGGMGGAPLTSEAGSPGAGADSGPRLVPTAITLAETTTNVVRVCSEPAVRFNDRCPPGQVLIGFNGTLEEPGGALYLRSIQGVCGTPSIAEEAPWAVIIAEAGTLPLRDLDLAQKVSARCPTGQVITAFSGRSGVWIDGLELYCAPLEVVSLSGELSLSIGTATSVGYLGAKQGGSAFAVQACPTGSVAVGQTGGTVLSGDVLGELGFTCAAAQLIVEPG